MQPTSIMFLGNSMKTVLLLALLAPAVAFAAASNDANVQSASSFTGINALADISGSTSFDGSEATMSPRFFRSGVVGDVCAEFSSGLFQYKTVDFTSDATGQLTVDFDPGTCDTGIFVTFHNASFNPANICQNYVWSDGSSVAFTETFAVTPNTPMQMVVSGVSAAPGTVCGPATYSIVGANAGAPFVPPIDLPALDKLGLLVLGVFLAGFAWFASRRRLRQ
jgi:hypothetical protein